MNIIQSFVIAFSMYSKIPMPRVLWNEKNMKYAFCFFPWIGAVIGILTLGLGSWLFELPVSPLFRGICLTLLPIVITGGIHLDGFLDTIDALSSYGDKERKLEILKDPCSGAFAIIGCGCYLLWSVGIWSEVEIEVLPLIACEYILSRALSGWSVVSFKLAKNTGLAATFRDGAKRKRVGIIMGIYVVLMVAVMVYLQPVLSCLVVACAGMCLAYHGYISYKKFGGITGDLAGYFLQICEILMITVTVLGAKIL